LVINNPNINVAGSAPFGVVIVTGEVSEDVRLELRDFGQITLGDRQELVAMAGGTSSTGGAFIEMHSGIIQLNSGQNDVLYATTTAGANSPRLRVSEVLMTGGEIRFVAESGDGYASGKGNRGIYARDRADYGNASVDLSGGLISLASAFPLDAPMEGIYSRSAGKASSAFSNIDIHGGKIELSGNNIYGARAHNEGLGEATITMDAGLVSLAGDYSTNTAVVGLYASAGDSNNSSEVLAELSGGTVSVSGSGAIGAHVLSQGTGSAIFRGSGTGTVSASGLDAIGVQVQATQSSATYAVTLSDSVSISGGSGDGAAIHTASVSDSSGSVTIGAGTTVDGSNGQAAILDGAGDTTVTNAGTVLGAIDLGDGADIFNFRPTGSVSGVIDGGAGEDTLRLGASLDLNNGGNPDANKYKNFEVFEFVTFSIPVVSNPSADLTVGVDEIVNITSDTTIETRALSGSGSVAIANGSTLTLEQANDSTFTGELSGAGNFVKSGAGTIILTGSHDLSGEVELREGVIVVDGSLVAATLDVGSSGRLQGSGTVGSSIVTGVLAPGNSPGTMTYAGDLTLNTGSVVELDLDGLVFSSFGGAGSYDRIVLTNSSTVATLGGTLTPILRGISGDANNDFTPVYGDTFTIVTTANPNGVSSVFDTVSQPTDGMPENARFDVIYASDKVDLVLTPDSYEQFAASFSAVANYRNFGRALDGIRPDAGANPDTPVQELLVQLYPLNGSQLATAIVPLTGEVHAFAITDLRDGAYSLSRNSYVGGLRPQSEGRNSWIDVSGTRLTYSQDAIASRYESDLGNIWVGFDLEQRDELRYGLAFGHGRSELDASIVGTADSTLTMLMGYYAHRVGDIAFGAKLGLGRGSFDTERSAVLADGLHSATASGAATLAFANVSAGFHHELKNGFVGKLWADLSVMHTSADSYVEGGSSAIALAVQGDTLRSHELTVGYQVTTSMSSNVADDENSATFGFGLRHAFAKDRIYSRRLTMHDTQWDVSGVGVNPTTAFASLSVTYAVGDQQTISGAVIGQGNEDYTGVGASLSFVSRF
jgi:autotransporter-associated beta strand protein